MVNTNTGNESLRELDSILKPLAQKAMQQAKRGLSNPEELPKEFALAFQREVDNTRTAISQKMYHIDMAMQGYGDSVERARFEFMEQQSQHTGNGEIREEDFVRETASGYLVFNGHQWIEMSLQSEIHLNIQTSPESQNKPAIHLFAYDPTTQKRVSYIDDKGISPFESGQFYDDAYDKIINKPTSLRYTDPMFGHLQRGSGYVGTIAGTLQAISMAEHYQYGLKNPFTGNTIMDGQWKSLDGQWRKFRDIEQAENAFKQNSLKTSKHWAEVRGVKAANAWKWTGRICFVITTGVSIHNMTDAYNNNDSNQKDVYIKNSLDITMGIVAFIPGFGWAISGTYFLMDAGKVFGSWGQASGFSQQQMDTMIDRDRTINRQKLYELDFEIEYHSPIEQIRKEMQRETRTFKRDNTLIIKPVLKNFH